MRVGFDIDDTMSRHWEFFSFLTNSLIEAGHEVVVITFRTERKSTQVELKQKGIAWTELIVADLDELLEVGVNEWKGKVCKQKKIEILFDDMPEVINHLPDETLGLMATDPSQGLVYYD